MSSQDAEIQKFLKQFEKASVMAIEACNKVIDKSIDDFMVRLKENTPFGNPSLWKYPAPPGYTPGQLRASWRRDNSGRARNKSTGRFESNKSLRSSHGIGVSLKGINVMVYNPQPYAERIEYGAWSSQAPAGMLRVTIAEFSSIVNKNAALFKIEI